MKINLLEYIYFNLVTRKFKIIYLPLIGYKVHISIWEYWAISRTSWKIVSDPVKESEHFRCGFDGGQASNLVWEDKGISSPLSYISN